MPDSASRVRLAPSILSADFGRLAEQIAEVEESGLADWIHIDVMDGVFVPNLTIGPLVVEAVKRCTKLPLDVHLMIRQPSNLVERFVAAGADIVTVHVEACPHINRDIDFIRRCGARAGVSLNPGTPAASVSEIIGEVDLVLVMTVNPGFGGQAFIPSVLPKLKSVADMARAVGDGRIEVSVDGGVAVATAPACVEAGATVLVAGSAVFGDPAGAAHALEAIRATLG